MSPSSQPRNLLFTLIFLRLTNFCLNEKPALGGLCRTHIFSVQDLEKCILGRRILKAVRGGGIDLPGGLKYLKPIFKDPEPASKPEDAIPHPDQQGDDSEQSPEIAAGDDFDVDSALGYDICREVSNLKWADVCVLLS